MTASRRAVQSKRIRLLHEQSPHHPDSQYYKPASKSRCNNLVTNSSSWHIILALNTHSTPFLQPSNPAHQVT
jgi:hypothetical protein